MRRPFTCASSALDRALRRDRRHAVKVSDRSLSRIRTSRAEPGTRGFRPRKNGAANVQPAVTSSCSSRTGVDSDAETRHVRSLFFRTESARFRSCRVAR